MQMRVYLCALAKNEQPYINEWVAHYVKLGFDKIYIYDNDDLGVKPSYKFIDEKYNEHIVVIDIRGQHYNRIQGKMYADFYKRHSKDFDWCLFCDIDEFLMGIGNIKKFLSKGSFTTTQQIRIKWKLFGDDNIIERDMNKGVVETFRQEIVIPLSFQGKTIVKGNLNNVAFNSVHFANYTTNKMLPSVLPSGKKCNSGVYITEDYSKETVFINHYMTKSLSEFVRQKMNRTDAVFGKRILDLHYYWRINKKTPEKEKYLKDMGLIQ